MESWTEIRTAYFVARLGSVSAAADALNLHRATVIRHVDALEAELGVKLFIRHGRGYTPLDAGYDLMRAAETTEEQLLQFAARTRVGAAEMAGELVITSLAGATPLIMPALSAFRIRHPDITLRHLAGAEILKLEFGEAHLAVRTAILPPDPDYVVQHLASIGLGLYASDGYIARRGAPESVADLARHDFVAPVDDHPCIKAISRHLEWLAEMAPTDRIVFRATDLSVMDEAVRHGVGLGLIPHFRAEQDASLRAMPTPRAGYTVDLNIVTHVDMHRTPKVQALAAELKAGVPRKW